MKVKVKLFATFRQGKFDTEEREFRPGTTVAHVIDGLGFAEKRVIIFVNNRHAAKEHELKDGDTLALFPPVGGG
jgi:molybdopterin synthase sulfur carrier subunit